MKAKVVKNYSPIPKLEADEVLLTFEDKSWLKDFNFLGHLGRYEESRLLTDKAGFLGKPFLTYLLVKLLSPRQAFVEDKAKAAAPITWRTIFQMFLKMMWDYLKKRPLISSFKFDARQEKLAQENSPNKKSLNFDGSPVYFRTDFSFGLQAGGSVGHIAGVLNNLGPFGKPPLFYSTDIIPTVDPGISFTYVFPGERFLDFAEIPTFQLQSTFYDTAFRTLSNRPLSFIYQRYSRNNYCGLKLARKFGVPFVLEYNGSEVWLARNWEKPLRYGSLTNEIELLNLKFADLIVVVSNVLKKELEERGIGEEKILVNPNGVEPARFSPEINGERIRRAWGLSGKKVVGFIGTFGHWHGSEILVEAARHLFEKSPHSNSNLRFLLVGDGVKMAATKNLINKYGLGRQIVLTGLVPQKDAPEFLAACDVLAAPHVPNPDGTRFFGSPTKLFEYMAMGKGIVASNLEQIGEVLRHNETGWLVKPGDAKELADGIEILLQDAALRRRLGEAARTEVLQKYTWKEHTRKTFDKLKNMNSLKVG